MSGLEKYSLKCNAFNAKGVDFGEKLFDKIGKEGRSVCHLSGSGFWSLSTSFGEKSRGSFFCFVRS